MASIRQIAKVTGFSPATVSRVLNHDPQLAVKNSTRRTITQAAHQLGYQAGHLSQIAAMNLQQSQILVLQVPQDPTLAYFSTINQGIRDEAALHGLTIGKWLTIPDQAFSYRCAQKFQAVVLIGIFERAFLEQLYQYNQNLIIIDDYRYFANYDLIRNNYEVATAVVLNRLYQLGHRRIAFIGGSEYPLKEDGHHGDKIADIRTSAYQKWMQAHHLAAHTYETGWHAEEAARVMDEILQSSLRFDAVLTASDILATGVYQAAKQHQVAIPKSLTVASFDDSQQATRLTPALSSVRPHSYEMGKMAVRLALERLLEHRNVPVQAILPANFIERRSI